MKITNIQEISKNIEDLLKQYENNRVELAMELKRVLDSLPDNMPQRITKKNGAIIILEDNTE